MHMGVFLNNIDSEVGEISFPHAHGGVSPLYDLMSKAGLFSPCTWGCFSIKSKETERPLVFPMHMGGFPKDMSTLWRRSSFTHEYGGVS